MTLFSDKTAARKHFLAKRLSLTDDMIADNSARLCRQIAELEQFSRADTLLLFYPTRNEPDLLHLARVALAMNKRVAFPISLTDTCTLSFRAISSLDGMTVGTYGIREPDKGAYEAALSEHTLCIVPALAFDKRGFRLGYGKGYYDRFLKGFSGCSIGPVLDGFLCDGLPTDSNDIPVDILITETGVIKTR